MTRAASALAALLPLLPALGAPAPAAPLPGALAPAPPFPAVVASSEEREPVAPGIARATYRLRTAAGPLVVHVVDVDLRVPSVRLGAVLARDRIVSKDETVSSMAQRTGAVAGINGDYFDIGASGAPLGLLVAGGTLDRAPSTRAALVVGRDRSVRFGTLPFAGSATFGASTIPLSGVNVWPPGSGASVLTPAFGAPPPAANVVVDTLEPLDPAAAGAASGVPARPGGRYRVAAVADGPPYPAGPAVRLAFGSAAAPPDAGDVLDLSYDTVPAAAQIAAAVGGGPMLLRDGAAVDDPASPNYAERTRRIPAAAAALLADGTLALVVVDGRRPSESVGVSRAELTALLRALGATDAMLFDSGGSATLVARVLGDAAASVVNDPSDGTERPVADGVFAYSDAPVGPPARLVVRPSAVLALPGARVPLRARLIDAADHGLGDARGPWRVAGAAAGTTVGADDVLIAGPRPAEELLRLERDGVAGVLPVRIAGRAARIVIGPARANPEPGGTVALQATAYDDRDRPLAAGGLVRWSARDATIDGAGVLSAGTGDATVTASAGGASATVTIPVGRHVAALPLFDEAHRGAWRLVTVPAGGSGSLSFAGGALRLGYDFTTGGRAAYADADVSLGEPLALSCAVEGDGNGAALRAVFSDRFGDRATVTLVRALDFTGPRRVTAPVPASLAPPVALRSLYVVGTLAVPPVAASGLVAVRDCSATVAGSGRREASPAQATPATNSSAAG